ncbi:probable xyloglucan 6-xylosyltransferase 5 [Andrographis paniculata]|uniref:probable xyloglucan 6-xylosyltransferase 5 n=1 Tax=Andrographis paniculata TaxID=175694 RepID=UPI0021E87319|nr:probable xyloglucan 6-xylosyltransferase 5 [Andrographis paniculata]
MSLPTPFSAQKRTSASLPSENGEPRGGAARLLPRGRQQIHKTFNNLKITILCGFITILVLRGTIGLGRLSSNESDGDNRLIIEETNRILAEIRSDNDGDGDEQFPDVNSTFSLGPTTISWDEDRNVWLQKNPQFPNYINTGNPRILLVTGSPPNPCENAIGDHYLLKGLKNKVDYCRIHGVEIVYNMANLDRAMAGNWGKLPLIRRLMLSHPEFEWIWWMNSDAYFTDMAFKLPLWKYNESNLVVHGYPDLLFIEKSWISLNTGSFLVRNCQWTLDLLDAWATMGPKGSIRDEAGKILTANLKGRPEFEADDQSALIYLLIMAKDKWMGKVYVENSYNLHGFWEGLVDRYEEMMEDWRSGLGDERWPFVTHFVGCKPCGGNVDYPVERCLRSMERAFNFADNQVLKLYGFQHRGLASPSVKRIRNESVAPLVDVDLFDIRHVMEHGRVDR